ncbi:MAG: DNA ligase [Sulfurovum sp.]|jgi:DNA ligase-1
MGKIILIFLILLVSLLNLNANDLQKAKTYKNNINDFSSWLMSEKLDGIRAYWNGKELLSKNGNKIYAPLWFTKNLPNFKLDGELWTKRNDFENIQNIVLDKIPSNKWKQITYNIFEVPNQSGNFIKRLNTIKEYKEKNHIPHLKIIKQINVKNSKHLDSYLNEIISKKGEGVILKNFSKDYFTGRSKNILKMKKFYDDEGEVIGINYNLQNKFKSLRLKYKNVEFNLGGGFSSKEKRNPPKIGDIVTFKYYSFTKNEIPKFASFLRIRKKE